MIDLLELQIPFKDEYVIKTSRDIEHGGGSIDLVQIAKLSGLRLSARDVEFEIKGDLSVQGLSHPFESLPTHFASLGMKVYQGTHLIFPRVNLKASPAKLLQGHNVFGSTDIALCGVELLANLAASQPELYDLLDVDNTEVSEIHTTCSARLPSETICKQVISYLKNISHGQTKATKANDHESTVYFNRGSKHRELCIYYKASEVAKRTEEIQRKLRKNPTDAALQYQMAVLNDKRLIEFSNNLLRLEGRLKKRFLRDNDIPVKFSDLCLYQEQYEADGKSLIYDLWMKSFHDLLMALRGVEMNIYDDEHIFNLLKSTYFSITPKGNTSYSKAQRVFGFYRRLVNEGYSNVLSSMSRVTFWRHLALLTDVGISKSQLQNLTGDKTNVIPFYKVINIDFAQQRPDWYVEPVSVFERQGNVYDFKLAANA
ncbi:phage/plasmid replication protein, II/X family [Xenorhabdus sp. SF857]|uniref:phage/plasmid replication protein, II/X family n=1 Tax=Xenorhabdus bakwenae TaxID=3026967 RepID=UPI0025580424|nr:phage/plasmid replication protein, II/X family [Xenorhabdus sp. SF857]WFQ80605.1 phage/plasmid replication protein, II/X family [Xenorhabdus sp. SF857]WFQ80615.1 phage/plasmid replication protein, II/X family [Xenorhabdus sp. SF857]